MAELTILGAGTPGPTPGRFGSSYVVKIGGEHLMFDCGPATTHKLVKAGLRPTDVDRLFFTHHHFDHNVDYPALLLTRWDQSDGTIPDLMTYGPAPTTRITNGLIGEGTGVFWDDINARINHPGSQRAFLIRGGTLPRPPLRVDTHDIEPGYVMETEHWRLQTSSAQHAQPWLDSIAYRLETQDGTIVFTGDTSPCEEVVNLARGCDLLVCMCFLPQELMEKDTGGAGDWVDFMCGSRDAGQVARNAEAHHLLLVHLHDIIDGHQQRAEVLTDVATSYGGKTIVGEEFMHLRLERSEVTVMAGETTDAAT